MAKLYPSNPTEITQEHAEAVKRNFPYKPRRRIDAGNLFLIIGALIALSSCALLTKWIIDGPQAAQMPQDRTPISQAIITTETSENAETPQEQPENQAIVEHTEQQEKLQSEISDLESQKADLQRQIEEANNAQAQLELEYTLTQIEIERQSRQDQLDTMQAKAEAEQAKAQADAEAYTAKIANQSAIEQAERDAQIKSIEEQAAFEVERQEKRNQQKINVDKAIYGAIQFIVFVGMAAAAVVIFLVVGWFYREGRAKHAKNMTAIRNQSQPIPQETVQTAPDMQARVAKMLSRSVAWWNTQEDDDGPVDGREQIQIPSYDKLGMSGADWTELTDYLVGLHVLEKKSGPGNGAKFIYGNLHEWMLAAMNGRLERVDPLQINRTSPPPVTSA